MSVEAMKALDELRIYAPAQGGTERFDRLLATVQAAIKAAQQPLCPESKTGYRQPATWAECAEQEAKIARMAEALKCASQNSLHILRILKMHHDDALRDAGVSE